MTTWPYLYPEFATGTLYMTDGKKYENEMNIHLAKGRLHFIDKDQVKEVRTDNIVLVELNGDQFTVLNGNVVKAVGDLNTGYVAIHTTIDYLRLNESPGPYGSKTDGSSTMRANSFETMGVINNYQDLLHNRSFGKEVALKSDYYLVVAGKVYIASRKGIDSQLDDAGKAALKAFLKKTRIRWQDSDSLLQLVDFLKSL